MTTRSVPTPCGGPFLYSADNLSLYHAHAGPKQGEMHVHEDIQVCFSPSGIYDTVWETAGGQQRQHPMSPGTLMICAPHQPHAIQVNLQAELAAVWLSASWLARAAEELTVQGAAEITDAGAARDPLLYHLCLGLLGEVRQGPLPSRLYVDAIATLMAAHLVRHHSAANMAAHETGGLSPRTLRRVMDYVWEHLDQDVSLADLADAAHLSESRFSPLFRRSTGLSPYQYVLAQRIERAKGLLAAGGSSIGEIALQVGFCDQSQFSRQFKKHVGLTPKRFVRDLLR